MYQHDLISLLAEVLNPVPGAVHARVKFYYELVAEPDLARVEEVFEVANEPAEQLVDQASLHLGGQLLEQFELFHDQVEIIVESI